MSLLEQLIVLYLLAMSTYGVRCAYHKFRDREKDTWRK